MGNLTIFYSVKERLLGSCGKISLLEKSVVVIVGSTISEMTKKRQAILKKKRFYKEFAIKDGRIITRQNPFSIKAVAKLYLQALKKAPQLETIKQTPHDLFKSPGVICLFFCFVILL